MILDVVGSNPTGRPTRNLSRSAHAERSWGTVMDNGLLAATVTPIATAASTASVAIVGILVNNKRFDSLERKLEKLDTSVEMMNGTTRELDKRLSKIEDRMFNRS